MASAVAQSDGVSPLSVESEIGQPERLISVRLTQAEVGGEPEIMIWETPRQRVIQPSELDQEFGRSKIRDNETDE
jgi:hypothetical protein